MAITTPTGYPPLRFTMGFKIGSTDIPDPAVFTGSESDLDALGERDATGYLHRDMVATKHPLKLEYHAIPWQTVKDICTLMYGLDKFTFTYPDPFHLTTSTIDAYVGDREFEAIWSPQTGNWIGNLKFSIIEY